LLFFKQVGDEGFKEGVNLLWQKQQQLKKRVLQPKNQLQRRRNPP
jgi:hypothetical protein